VPVTRTRIVTDWHTHSATASGRVTLGLPASNYLAQMYGKLDSTNTKESLAGIKDSTHGRFESVSALEIDPRFQHYQLQGNRAELRPLDTKYMASFRVLSCDVPAARVYNKQEAHNQIGRQIEQGAPGDRIRNLSFHGDIIPDYFLIYRPYWATVYTYDKKICASYADGTNAGKHYGTRPIDKAAKKLGRKFFLPFKISVAAAALVILIGAITGAGEGSLLLEVIGPILIILVGLTGLFGLIARGRLKKKNKKATMEHSQSFLANPSQVFQRKSATADPTSDI